MSVYKTDKVLVAAIDFGTTYSGYAFSFKDEFQKDPSKIITNTTWVAGHKSLLSWKTPTCLLLKPDKTFDSFGYAAEDKYTELANDEEHSEWYFFRRFKMTLHGEKLLSRDIELVDEGGKKLPAGTVFAHGIRYLRTHLLQLLDTRGLLQLVSVDMITWVLTIPAIWNDSAKQFMREAAKEAGIESEKLILALEPEAAALYCKILPIEKLVSGSSSNLAVFQPGTRYMILDLGGGTVDVTIQEVLEDNKLKELHKASGGAWGGTYVDSAFIQLIIRLVGNPVYQKFKEDYPADDLELLREFEIKKRSVGKSENDKVTFRVPVSLTEIFEEEYEGESIKSVVQQSRYAGKLSWTGDKLRVGQSVIDDLFEICRDSIVEHVEALLRMPQCKDVNTLIMVGGFSECKLLQDVIKDRFSHKRVIIPEEAGLAVVKGAVLFGHNPKTIISRMTKFTYGVKSNRDFEPDDLPEKKFMVDGKPKCCDTFSKHVIVNTSVPVGEPLEPQYYRPLHKNHTEVVIPIYTSTDGNPRYTSEATCTCLGQLTINLSQFKGSADERLIEVRMTFGGTELIVEAKEYHSNKPCKATFDFLAHHGE